MLKRRGQKKSPNGFRFGTFIGHFLRDGAASIAVKGLNVKKNESISLNAVRPVGQSHLRFTYASFFVVFFSVVTVYKINTIWGGGGRGYLFFIHIDPVRYLCTLSVCLSVCVAVCVSLESIFDFLKVMLRKEKRKKRLIEHCSI